MKRNASIKYGRTYVSFTAKLIGSLTYDFGKKCEKNLCREDVDITENISNIIIESIYKDYDFFSKDSRKTLVYKFSLLSKLIKPSLFLILLDSKHLTKGNFF